MQTVQREGEVPECNEAPVGGKGTERIHGKGRRAAGRGENVKESKMGGRLLSSSPT